MKQKLFRSLLLLTMGSVLLVVALFAWLSVHYITNDSYQSLKREAALLLEEQLGTRYGGSSGTNFVACLQLAAAMRERGERGSIVSLLCDRGERYAQTLYQRAWLAERGLDLDAALQGVAARAGMDASSLDPA